MVEAGLAFPGGSSCEGIALRDPWSMQGRTSHRYPANLPAVRGRNHRRQGATMQVIIRLD